MRSYTAIQQFEKHGFSLGEIAIMPSENDQIALEMLNAGRTKSDVSAYVSAGKSVSTKKEKAKVENSGKAVKNLSLSVLKQGVDFGGLQTPKFIEWKDRLCLVNEGTGGRANGLFLPVSNDEKVVDFVETYAQAELLQRVLENHSTVVMALQEYCKAEALKLGIKI